MLYRLLTVLFLFSTLSTRAQTVTVSQDYGYNANDATTFLQMALDDPAATTIIIDAQPTPWISGPLILRRDNVTLVFETNTVLEAKANAFTTFESLLLVNKVSNISIQGNNATLRMRKAEYPSSSQFRHCISLNGVQSATVQDLILRDAGGDGILISPGFINGDPTIPCRNIVLDNLICDNNNRQGCSVTDVIGLEIKNCQFINTNGTEPEAGIDFEPFRTFHRMQNITVSNCLFKGNHGNGVLFAGVDLDNTTPPVSIVMDNCTFEQNGQSPTRQLASINISNKTFARGTFTVSNSRVRNEPYAGVNVRQYINTLAVTIENTVFSNVENEFVNDFYAPLLVQPPFYERPNDPPFGGVAFNNVTLIDDQNRRQFVLGQFGPANNPTEQPPQDITGNVLIDSPFPIQTYLGRTPGDNVTITFREGQALPLEVVDFKANQRNCQHELSWEVANMVGVATYFLEQADVDQAVLNWKVIRKFTDFSSKAVQQRLVIDRNQAAFYRLRSVNTDGSEELSKIVTAKGCPHDDEQIQVFPNPVQDELFIYNSADQTAIIVITNVLGQVVQTLRVAGGLQRSISNLAEGYYFIRAEESGQISKVLVQ